MSSDAAALIPYTPGQKQSPSHPFPHYATGWFQVAYCDEIKSGEVKPLKYFGKPLAMFRTESGKLAVLDARCPHMGAHLGRGGKVKGESVACPSHGWQFGADGACTGVPYLPNIPPRTSVACWPVQEENGLIMVWHDIDKKPPAWEVPHVPEFYSDDWITPVRREWKIRISSHEIVENLVEKAHFGYVRTQNMPESSIEFDGHKLRFKTPMIIRTPAGKVEGQVESFTVGLGLATNHFTGLGEALLIGCVSPIDKEYVHLRLTFTFRKEGGADVMSNLAEAFVAEASRQLEEDKSVWENEVKPEQSLMCDGDRLIGQFRSWVGQFYPEWYKEEARAAFEEARRTRSRHEGMCGR
jgi:3-ketosteroid 9alpha-monooxygenase subunit A